jgi:hypothetical protein
MTALAPTDLGKWKVGDLDNLTGRVAPFNDMNGQRTSFKTQYLNFAFSWQQWFSPSIYIRPEIAWYSTTDGQDAFDRNPAAGRCRATFTQPA